MSLIKLIVVLTFLAILVSLGSGLVYLFRDDVDSKRTVKALTVRVGLSIGLFVMLVIAAALGIIEPGNL